MKNLKEAIRVKEEQVRVLMEQIDKLRAAAAILDQEDHPLEVVVEPATPPKAETGNAPVQKRAWP